MPKYEKTLCWECRNAVPSAVTGRGCEWSKWLQPVPGWTAEGVKRATLGDTWIVHACPKYIPDRPWKACAGPKDTRLFPQRLQELRERRGLSQSILSELCGLSKNMIARYERGERIPSIVDAALIAEYFDVSLDYLYGREKEI